jgi:transcriptional regulator with XRE-family HTH domain
MLLPELGVVLLGARKERHLSQAELAKTLGMSRATISAIENGTIGEIGVRKLMALATALGLEFSLGPRHSRPTLQELREERRGSKSGT